MKIRNVVKVSKSWKQFMVSSILPKNEQNSLILSILFTQDSEFHFFFFLKNWGHHHLLSRLSDLYWDFKFSWITSTTMRGSTSDSPLFQFIQTCPFISHVRILTILPQILSSLEFFHPLNSFLDNNLIYDLNIAISHILVILKPLSGS